MTGTGPDRSGLEFLGQLAGGLVHEIKNPLSTLRINLTLLKEDLQASRPDEPAFVRRIEVLECEVARLNDILSDFMRYAGMRKLQRARTALDALVREVLEFLEPGLRRDGVAVVTELFPVEAEVDVALLKQALLNLLLNAQQAIEGAGTVRVRVLAEGEHAVVEIEDDGRGIPAEELERVFDVYYSGSRAGSGLGLPTARRILEEHKGSLRLDSTPGRGTRVRMELPRS